MSNISNNEYYFMDSYSNNEYSLDESSILDEPLNEDSPENNSFDNKYQEESKWVESLSDTFSANQSKISK